MFSGALDEQSRTHFQQARVKYKKRAKGRKITETQQKRKSLNFTLQIEKDLFHI